jgi:hypothetical protein
MRKKSRRDTQIAAALEVVYHITNGRLNFIFLMSISSTDAPL